MRKFGVVLALVAVVGLTFAATTASSANSVRYASLKGSSEVPFGDAGGAGQALVSLQRSGTGGRVCWQIQVSGIGPVILAHIHVGPAGVNGPVVVDFNAQLTGCTFAAQSLVDAISRNPENYYVNVHTAEFPGGAVRGQLQVFAHR